MLSRAKRQLLSRLDFPILNAGVPSLPSENFFFGGSRDTEVLEMYTGFKEAAPGRRNTPHVCKSELAPGKRLSERAVVIARRRQ